MTNEQFGEFVAALGYTIERDKGFIERGVNPHLSSKLLRNEAGKVVAMLMHRNAEGQWFVRPLPFAPDQMLIGVGFDSAERLAVALIAAGVKPLPPMNMLRDCTIEAKP